MALRHGIPLLLGLAEIACGHAGAFTPQDHQAITAVIHAQREAWNRADIDQFMVGYARTPELIFTSGGAIRRGWDDTIAKYKKSYGQDRSSMGQLEFEILDIRPLGADGAIVLGKWRLTGTANAGSGVFSLAFQRFPEGWKIVHDHTSADPGPKS